jgi:hypothetical protein
VRRTMFVHRDMNSASLWGRESIPRAAWIFYGVEVANVEASSVGTIEGAIASTMTGLVLVELRPDWSVAT